VKLPPGHPKNKETSTHPPSQQWDIHPATPKTSSLAPDHPHNSKTWTRSPPKRWGIHQSNTVYVTWWICTWFLFIMNR
jgi:hypothetical protein